MNEKLLTEPTLRPRLASLRGRDIAVSAKKVLVHVKWAYIMHTKQIIYASAVFAYINALHYELNNNVKQTSRPSFLYDLIERVMIKDPPPADDRQ